MYVVASSICDDPSTLGESAPDVWRDVRRFNSPVQLAVAAAQNVAAHASDASRAALIALAPCQSGSPALFDSARRFARHEPTDPRPFRVNPTYTLHAVDNLALSALSIALGNRGPGLGLGGAPGQSWEALQVALEQLVDGAREVLIFAGDQDDAERAGAALGVALLLRREPPEWRPLVHLELPLWVEGPQHEPPRPHAARGLAALVRALSHAAPGRFEYAVPTRDGDGTAQVSVVGTVS